MRTCGSDLRFAIRYLTAHPAFACGGVAILAIGISLAATLFAVIKGAVLEPWPYRGADRLVTVRAVDVRAGVAATRLWSGPEVEDLRRLSDVFDDVIAGDARNVNLTYDGRPERVRAATLTPNAFAMLAVPAELGRTAVERDADAGAPGVAVVSDAFWRTRLGADPGAIGRMLRLEDASYQVVGVMPPAFRFWDREIWLPLRLEPNAARTDRRWYVQARLHPGVSIDTARTRLALFMKQLAAAHPDRPEYGTQAIALNYLTADVLRDLTPTLYLLVAAVAVVLLVAAANLANTLLTRGLAREGELAIRRAIGGSGAQLARQLLVESAVIGVAGGLTGAAGAAFLLPAVIALVPYGYIPAEAHVAIDWAVVAAAAACGFACSLLFGAIPALRAIRVDPAVLLKRADTRTGSRQTHAWRDRLVVAQIALAVLVLAVATAALLTLRGTLRRAPGFDADGIFTARVALPLSTLGAARASAYERIERELSTAAGVRGAAIASSMPIVPLAQVRLSVGGLSTGDPRDEVDADLIAASPQMHALLRIPMIEGRAFSAADTSSSPQVAIVNESLARRLWPDGSPIGRALMVGDERATVVGVSANVATDPSIDATRPLVVVPLAQQPPVSAVVAVRSGDRDAALTAVSAAVGRVDAGLPVFSAEMLEDTRLHALGPQLLAVVLLGTFGVAVLLLSAVGTYAVISQSVIERGRELAIRRAFGAANSTLLRGELVRAARIVASGAIAGALAAAGAVRLLSASFAVFQAGGGAAIPFGATTVALLGLGASAVPAWRALTRNLSAL